MKNLVKPVRTLFLILSITFAFLEMFARLVPDAKNPELFQMQTIPELEKTAWISQWRLDHAQLRRNFRAYELYQLDAFQGNYIHINRDGYRSTKNSSSGTHSEVERIGVFGGSTVWGSYSRDDFTIPSEISAALNLEAPVSISNFAQVGFVFSQEAHEALRILYSVDGDHPKPQRMVFIDGVNDVLAGIHNFTQGIEHPQALPWENQKYKYLFKLGNTGEIGLLDILKKFKSVRLVTKVLENKGWIRAEPKGKWVEPTPDRIAQLSKEVAQQYINLVRVVHQACLGNGVETLFVLQPILASKLRLTVSEKELLAKNRAWEPYIKSTYSEIRKLADALPKEIRFLDLGDFFKNEPEPVFSDVIHYSELGNEKIGRYVADYLLKNRQKHPLALK
jgi:hypothetical protein